MKASSGFTNVSKTVLTGFVSNGIRIVVLLCLNVFFTNAQQFNTPPTDGNEAEIKSFEITAEAHGFKCPFLTPKYIQRIHKLDSCRITRGDNLEIRVDFLKPTIIGEEQLVSAAEKTGYERRLIKVKEIERR